MKLALGSTLKNLIQANSTLKGWSGTTVDAIEEEETPKELGKYLSRVPQEILDKPENQLNPIVQKKL